MNIKKTITIHKRLLPSIIAVFCSILIVAGMAYVASSSSNTTTIGQNISTNNIAAAGTLEVTGNATTTGNFVVSGTSTLATTTVSGNLTLSGIANFLSNLIVAGNATTTGNQVVSGNLNVSGTSTLATTTLSGDLDLGLQQIKNVVLEKLSAFPSSPVEGQMFWSTASSTPYWYTGSQWLTDASAATLVVAASDSTTSSKSRADYISDGTDDQVEIKAAIDALPSTGGRVVLMEGTFYINSEIEILDTSDNHYVTLEGQGMGTILKVPNGHSSTMAVVEAYGTATSVKSVIMKNFRINGNKSNVTGDYYIGINYNNVYESVIDGVYLSNGKGDGGGNGYGFMVIDSTDVKIRNCTGKDWDFEPMEIRNSERVLVTGCTLDFRLELYDNNEYVKISNNHFYNLTIFAGTNTGASSYIDGLDISNNYFYSDSASYPAVWLIRTQEAKTTGNYIYSNNTGVAVAVDNSHTNIVANHFYSNLPIDITGAQYGQIIGNKITMTGASNDTVMFYNSGATRPSYWIIADNYLRGQGGNTRGIRFYEYSDDNVIKNNVFVDFATGITIPSGSNRNEITGNNFINSTTPISDAGTDTKIRRNVGYITENSSSTTITSGNTYVNVSHGLDIQPATSTISVIPTNNLGDASSTSYWISDVGASTFRINVGIDPGASGAEFSWQVGSY